MENDPNPFPEFEIIKPMESVLKLLGKLSMYPSQVDLKTSEHIREPDNQLKLEFED